MRSETRPVSDLNHETPAPGSVLAGKLRVERVIGIGGMGIVLEATHLFLDERVAVKLLLPEAQANVDLIARFTREAKAAARIKSEHVARVLDVVVTEDGRPMIVMEYLEGTNLGDLVAKGGALPIPVAVDFILQACEAIAEAHTVGIVHRDLKPENLFLAKRPDGSPLIKVLDFGISKLTPRVGAREAAHTKTSELMGSPLYMSPEQMRSSRDVDARADIWSLGVVLFELLTARTPFGGDTLPQLCTAILESAPKPAKELRPDLPVELEAVLHRCMKKDPRERYAEIAELAEELAPFATEDSGLSIRRITALRGRVAPPPVSGPDVLSTARSSFDGLGNTEASNLTPAPRRPDAAKTTDIFVGSPLLPSRPVWRAWAGVLAAAALALAAAVFFRQTTEPSRVQQTATTESAADAGTTSTSWTAVAAAATATSAPTLPTADTSAPDATAALLPSAKPSAATRVGLPASSHAAPRTRPPHGSPASADTSAFGGAN